MHIYFSGIGGVAIGPLARIAKDLGYEVSGSDSNQSRYTASIKADGIPVHIPQTAEYIEELHSKQPIDWFVFTSGLSDDHPELNFVRENSIKHSKRDEFINQMLVEHNLQMLAVAGTHGKTNTTGMLIWVFQKLGIPVSYSVGTNISFGPNGKYEKDSKYFLYEADEYDRNFLKFKPYNTIITTVDYDHPDTYPTEKDYIDAFHDFAHKSHCVYTWQDIAVTIDITHEGRLHLKARDTVPATLKLVGEHTRENATLIVDMVSSLLGVPEEDVINAINEYPGTERRMEKLSENIVSDYAHHPVEIKATIEAAREMNKSVVVVYQPHQNVRQHELKDQYKNVFDGAEKVYWLPTYLSREDKNLEILTPENLVAGIENNENIEITQMDQDLIDKVYRHKASGSLVVFMSAGDLDDWAREKFI